MNLRNIIKVLRQRWLVIFLTILVGLCASATFGLLRPVLYTSDTILYVAAQNGASASAAYDASLLSQDRVASYRSLVTSDRVLGETARRLGNGQTVAALSRQVAATSTPDSVLIQIAVSNVDPQLAQRTADVVSQVVVDLVNELERPDNPATMQAVSLRIVQPATIPLVPSSTPVSIIVISGLLAALVVGVGAAFLRDRLDTTVRDLDLLSSSTSAPNLGITAKNPNDRLRSLIVSTDPRGSEAEAYRHLRTNLQFLDVDTDRRVLLFTSALPAESKTSTTANLAVVLSQAGSKVLVVDADLRRPAMAETFNVRSEVGLTTVLSGRVTPDGAIQHWDRNLSVMASGKIPPNPSELLSSMQMRQLINRFRAQFDYVLIDSAPLLPVTDSQALSPAVDGTILICRHGRCNIAQLERASNSLRQVSDGLLGTIFSVVPDKGVGGYQKYGGYYYSSSAVQDDDQTFQVPRFDDGHPKPGESSSRDQRTKAAHGK